MRSSRPGAFLDTPPPQKVTLPPRALAAPSRLKILIAGVDKDVRGSVEATIRQAFAGRDPAEPWSVSLVRLGASWSVTLAGPGERFRNLSFVAEQHRLADAVREAISSHPPPPPAAGPLGSRASSSGRSRIEDRHVCGKCGQALLVSYEGEPDEPKQGAPVACPHCWSVSHVEIGGWAAAGGDYVAAKA
jgi:DNA-directed RNA polymerase subunit RPC12/RpoP